MLLGFLIAAVIVFPTFNPGDLVAGLGLTSVALGFAFKDVLQNFFAGLLILWRRPFVVGDQIKVREYEGTVEEINVRSTRIKTYDGERAIIPNADATQTRFWFAAPTTGGASDSLSESDIRTQLKRRAPRFIVCWMI